MNIVIPVNDLAMTLSGFFDRYRMSHRNSLLPLKISLEDNRKIIKALIEEAVTSRLRWVAEPVDSGSVIAEVIPGYVPEAIRVQTQSGQLEFAHCERSLSIERAVLSPVWFKIEEIIGKVMPDRCWHMWTTSAFGYNVVLEQGIDFRIYEWERLLDQKVISYPHIVAGADDFGKDPKLHETILKASPKPGVVTPIRGKQVARRR